MAGGEDASASLARARRARDLFDQVLDHDDEARSRLLAEVTQEDAVLAAEVRALLAGWERSRTAELFPGLASQGEAAREKPVLVPPSVVGNYRLGRLLGRGGMGAVYEAEHVVLRDRAAVKVLHPHLAADPSAVGRLLNEARAINAIRHPHLVVVKDAGLIEGEGGAPYIVMELLHGESLAQRLERVGPLPVMMAGAIACEVAEALAAAHAAGVVHRDLKPENIFLSEPHDEVKVLDFGIAKLRGPLAANMALTDGGPCGTPQYMAPEQWRGRDLVDERTDVYALGLVLSEMLRGRTPGTPAAPPVTPPAPLISVVGRAAAAEAEQRHPSMRAFGEDLRLALAEVASPGSAPGARPRRRRVGLVALATFSLATVALAAVAVAWWGRSTEVVPSRPQTSARAEPEASATSATAPASAHPAFEASAPVEAPSRSSPAAVKPLAAVRPHARTATRPKREEEIRPAAQPPKAPPPAGEGSALPAFLRQNPY